MRFACAAAMLVGSACGGETVRFELDVVVVDSASGKSMWIYVKDLDGPVCVPETPWPAVGECSQSTDNFSCSEESAFRCLREARVVQSSVLETIDLSSSNSEAGMFELPPISISRSAQLELEGCGQSASVDFPNEPSAPPVIDVVRDNTGVDLSWTLPAGATNVVYRTHEEASFVSPFCRTDSTSGARITVSGDRPLDVSVMALQPPIETSTPFGAVRIWRAGMAVLRLAPVP